MSSRQLLLSPRAPTGFQFLSNGFIPHDCKPYYINFWPWYCEATSAYRFPGKREIREKNLRKAVCQTRCWVLTLFLVTSWIAKAHLAFLFFKQEVFALASIFWTCAVQHGSHQPCVAIEHLQCDKSEWRCVLSVKYIPDFEDLVPKKEYKISH